MADSWKEYLKGALVTIPLSDSVSSNTYVVDQDCGETVLLSHPLFPDCLIRRRKDQLDTVSPNVKDSTERGLDFAKSQVSFLDYNTSADLDALCLYFIVRKKLTPRQKSILSNINGIVASILLNNDIRAAMDLIIANEGILDEFNDMWYRNFQGLFKGSQHITSKKQRSAIFNIAGFVIAELAKPVTQARI